jgi:lysophospholipase L1-like esterase
VLIGINDVWHNCYNPFNREQVDIESFENRYRKLLTQTHSEIGELVLMTPYIVEPDIDDPMRVKMDAYGKVVKRLATEFNAILVDVQAAFDNYLVYRSARSLCDDRIHPNTTGHMIITKAFLSAIEFNS